MKRKIITSVFLYMVFCALKAQNLVPNYSFEQINKCTTGDGQFNGYVADWTGQSGSNIGLSYYTHQCPGDSAGGGSVPYNTLDLSLQGFQYAHTGVSYGSIITFISGGDSTYPYGNNPLYANVRNYMQAVLTSSLTTGTTYYVDFYVNLMNGSWYSCNDIGAYLSDSALIFDNKGTGLVKSYLTPQVANDPKKRELNDTINWLRVSGSFVAKGGEKYIIIGNFKNDATSSIRYLGQPSQYGAQAWYYIDDVIVSPDSNYADSLFSSIDQLTMNSVQCKVYPNPSNGIFQFQIANGQQLMANSQVEIYNTIGQKVYSEKLPAGHSTLSINISNQPNGLYLYRIINTQGAAIASGKLVIQ